MPGEMRFEFHAVVSPQENGDAQKEADRLGDGGRPTGSGDSPAQMEDEQLVEQDVGQRGDDSDVQGDAREADAIEEAEHSPRGDSECRASNTWEPERGGELLDLVAEAEGREDEVTRSAYRHEQRCSAKRCPQRHPD